jgi:hypothetical protein
MGKRYLQMPDGKFIDYKSDFNFDMKFTLETLGDYAHWDGYITPDGCFYTTKPSYTDYWNGSYNCHQDFADDYVYCVLGNEEIDSTVKELVKQLEERNKDEWYRINGAKDYVVEFLGWVSIGHSNMTGEVYTCVPHKEYFGHKVTEIQKKIALEIYQANKYNMKDYFWKFDGISPYGDEPLSEEEIKLIDDNTDDFDPTVF